MRLIGVFVASKCTGDDNWLLVLVLGAGVGAYATGVVVIVSRATSIEL